MTQLVVNFQNKGKYGVDQTFLNEVVWPLIANNQMSHDAYNCRKDFGVTPKHLTNFEYGRPFPTKRSSNYQHVGQVGTEVYTEDNCVSLALFSLRTCISLRIESLHGFSSCLYSRSQGVR